MYNLSEQTILEFKQRLKNGSKVLGVEVSDSQADLMLLHTKELMAWNKKTNLTAIREPLQIAEKHFIDSIACVSFFENTGSLMDIGAGGGFPGIPIKIMCPDLKVVLVDASRKKVNFLKHVIRLLHLKDIEAIHTRVEDLHDNKEYKARFDAVISRAFTELSGFVDLAAPFLNKEGIIYAMKGKQGEKEITAEILKKFNLDTNHYQLPFEKSERFLIKLSVKG